MSGGRLVLGIGCGDFAFEFEQLGLPFPGIRERQQALEDTLQVLGGLLDGAPAVTHESPHVRVANATLLGASVPQPRIPILLGGGGERVTLRQVAQYADVSNLSESQHAGTARTTEDVARKYAVLKDHCDALGRPYESILRTHMTLFLILAETPAAVEAKRAEVAPMLSDLLGDSIIAMTPDEAIAYYRRLVEAGVQYFIPAVSGNDEETLHLLAQEVVPAVQPT